MKTVIYSVSLMLLFSACSRQTATPLSSEIKQQIAMLPADAQIIGFVNVNQVLHSPVYELLQEEATVDPFDNKSYQEFMQLTGFDLRENMNEMYFAATQVEDEQMRGMFVANGNFDRGKMTSYLKDRADGNELTEEEYAGFTLLTVPDNDFVICFPDSNHVIAGSRQLLQSWLGLFTDKDDTVQVNSQLLKRIEALSDRESMWMIMDAGTLIESAEREGIGFARGFKNVHHTDFSMTMSQSFQFYSRITCADAEKAELVYDALRGFVSSAKLSVSDDRDAVDVLNKIDIQTQSQFVTGSVELSREEIKKLLQKREILKKVDIV